MSAKKGRKGAYETVVLPNMGKIKKMLERGALDKEIYTQLGIGKSTWFNIKKTIPEFMDFIENERTPLVSDIEDAMFKSATGYTLPIRKGMKVKRVEYENGRKVAEYEEVQEYVEDMHVPPNPSSGKFLLMNWAKDKYTNDPKALDLKREEFELKKEIASKEQW